MINNFFLINTIAACLRIYVSMYIDAGNENVK